MFRTSLCPSSGEQDRVLLHMVFCTGCDDCGCVELGRRLCALCTVIINIGLVASCWFISLHPTFHYAPSQGPKSGSVPSSKLLTPHIAAFSVKSIQYRTIYRGADKSLARPGSKQANVSVRMALNFLRRLVLQG